MIQQSCIEPHETILEYPHPSFPNKEIDTYVPSKQNRGGLIAEFKYDRKIPSGKNSPRPYKAGKLFNDLYRLTNFKEDSEARRWFIYLTDDEMANYLRNKKMD